MTLTTAILVFDDVQIIDYTGPFEALGRRGPTYLVAQTLDVLTTNMGMKVMPNHTFDSAPAPDVLVIPGGGSSGEPGIRRYGVGAQIDNPVVIDWIRATAATARYVLSVCNGAFLAQRAGLLDGLTATTTAGYIDYLASIAPSTRVVRDQRVVDNGKVVVTGGLTAGIDGALRIIEKAEGFGTAVTTSLHMEYDWRPADGWSRAALADNRVPFEVYGAFSDDQTELLEFENGLDAARELWSATSDVPPAELLRRIDAVWDTVGWTRTEGGERRTAARSTDPEGGVWQVVVAVEDAGGAAPSAVGGRPNVRIEVVKAG